MNLKEINEVTEEEFLKNYKPYNYERPSLTVDMILFTLDDEEEKDLKKVPEKVLKVLLIKRKNHPFKNCWAIPGGFVDINENIEDAVYRELKEETNIDNVYLEQLYTWGDVNRDPRMRVVSTSYMALVNKENINVKAGDDAADAAWFTIKKKIIKTEDTKIISQIILENATEDIKIVYEITENIEIKGYNKNSKFEIKLIEGDRGLAFDHVKILNYSLERMRNKVQYTTIAFSLLPKEFTLMELQQVYELLLGRTLVKQNFRRWISPMVSKTDKVKSNRAYRPSSLYILNKSYIINEIKNI
ncbi:NUDIX hydrolase [Inconstantimicrobium porci]|uniref:NUDIX hydrolase n=1 Tax=Inconstantimicrobium porci TaxID=2652291 RepID=UPI00240A139B|nr:NUDIX domain-containing protein [Inconstantimicrobium porci]MDD6769366.1 NUDIX domain-containing protein [Inconstantimicrobium porci]